MRPSCRAIILICVILTCLILAIIACLISTRNLVARYYDRQSVTIVDRNNNLLVVQPNDSGMYALYATSTPQRFAELLLKKEDRLFYVHPGVNPVSIGELLLSQLGLGDRQGASTLEQQLVKLLLGHENQRTVMNKSLELASVIPLDLVKGKKWVLLSYMNTAYFGNRIQGVETASRAYFGTSADRLSDAEILQLLVSLNNPSYNNPLLGGNSSSAQHLATVLNISVSKEQFVTPEVVQQNLKHFLNQKDAFELNSYVPLQPTERTIQVSIDKVLSDKIRGIAQDAAPSLAARDAHNMAIFVMSLPSNEILAMIGSSDSAASDYGQQVNMLEKPRQIASTVKPFVYVKAFEKGARPDSLIDDVSYGYTTFDGRILYPKNYDLRYHGRITAAYALANSINIPAIKTLQFVGLDNFASFLGDLGYTDTKKVHDHQLGAALGTIDMTLPELVHFYSIFPSGGIIRPLHLFADPVMNTSVFPGTKKQVIDPHYTELVTQILSDRYIGMEQFGYASDLNLPYGNYALKTGTSDDYRDTWVIGYTPDYMVGVWVGNSDNTPTKDLSGQSGAGEVWSRVMQFMQQSAYDSHRPFSFEHIPTVEDSSKARTLLLDAE